jgi:hypothetical protein
MFRFFVYKPNLTEANKWSEDIWGKSEGPITKRSRSIILDITCSSCNVCIGKENSRNYIDLRIRETSRRVQPVGMPSMYKVFEASGGRGGSCIPPP